MSAAVAIFFVFAGCCSNVVFLEYLVKDAPSSGNIITFAQFLLIAVEGFIFTMKGGTVKPKIPLSTYFVMVSLFFVVQVSNNYAFAYDVPMTLHMIFRAGSLMANLILGVILLGRRYSISKYLSVVMITVGIILATFESANAVGDSNAESGKSLEQQSTEFSTLIIGIAILSFALFMSARMGIFQETVYKEHGKHPSESLFFNHALPLPGFIFVASDIYTQAQIFSQSAPVSVPVLPMTVPYLWLCLVGNVITQYICIRSVFVLTTECTSLTVTLVVTLRKFVSLMFSIFYFGNDFTLIHWLATSMVFGGTLIFTDTIKNIYAALVGDKKKAE